VSGGILTSLADFIQDLYTGAIDPTTSYFLPSVILEQPKPAEPLAVGDGYWGDLAPLSADLATNLCAAIAPGSICAPGTTATMSMTGMQVVGISNVLPASPPAVSGTTVNASFAFGGVKNLPPGVTVPPYTAVEGNFQITLSCCASGDGRQCSGTPAPQPITGTFAVGLVGAVLSTTLNVDASFAVTCTSLSLAAAQLRFAFQTESPLIAAGPINTLLQNAFTAAGGPAALGMINRGLAAQATLTGLSGILTPTFQSLANPPLLAFLASIMYRNAVNTSSSWYLPTAISTATNPVLEPYDAGSWDMADVGQWYAAAGSTICASIGASDNKYEIQTPGTPVPLSLSNISISGTSNMLPVPMLTVGNTVYGMVACNSVKQWPKTLTVSGDFTLGVNCCVSARGVPGCTGPSAPSQGSGTFTAKFATASAGVAVTVSAGPDDKLVGTVDALYFRCDPNVDNPSNMTFHIDITSITGGDRKDWNDMAAGIFNSPQATSAIVDQVRARLNSQKVLDRLSEIVTHAIQQILAEEAELAARLLAEIRMVAR
jgi:hypothetical protein